MEKKKKNIDQGKEANKNGKSENDTNTIHAQNEEVDQEGEQKGK